ncbi:hypothetical protein Pyn_37112 [Prunus yedoensis var. nudiflora]|uniref:Uncharacterized protein n=1 Tax=Prunus yedoensis var. nudiflora TaxID=2094558 RepID=A0A314Y455_PRUYE|nr:hypothetical protein Pyn_37112 [Prunus yedoensis var. nudiflora]
MAVDDDITMNESTSCVGKRPRGSDITAVDDHDHQEQSLCSSSEPADHPKRRHIDIEEEYKVLIFLICIWTINLETRRSSISASSLSHINISEIDENSGRITEEIEKCKEQSLEKKRGLEEAKEQVEKAAYVVLEMLNNRG